MSLPPVLSMGFSPAAALITWRLSLSKLFQCYTYWPATKVSFESEVFGQNQIYEPTGFDLADPAQASALPSKAFAVVILVVPTIKDVVRMCRRLQPVVSKQTLILVDVSGGIAPLQRLVKTNTGSAVQVSGLICDIDAEFTSQSGGDDWTIIHRKPASNAVTNGSNALTIEPCSSLSKVIAQLESAWMACGIQATHAKTCGSFGEIQWQRTIGAVVFEVLTVALDLPEPEALADSLIAKPIIEGLVGELSMVAAASGIKGLPSRSQLVKRGPALARRAPASFKNSRASRVYYDVFRKAHVALDFLVLLPILLSDELPKGGATPYLESLYAFMNRILDLNNGTYESALFQRAGAGPKQVTTQVDPLILANIESRTRTLDTRENELQARESRYQQVLEDLRVQQQQHGERVAQFDNQWAQNERRLQSFEELNARSEQLRLREEQLNDLERKAGVRDRTHKQRELDLVSREQALLARENELLSRGAMDGVPNGVASGGPNGVAHGLPHGLPQGIPNGVPNGVQNGLPNGSSGSTPPQMSPQVPMTPGGTVYSRFDPKAPPVASAPPAPPQQAPPMQNGGQRMNVPFYGAPPSSSTSINSNRPRHSVSGAPMMSQSSSRTQIASPQMQYYGGMQPQMGPGQMPMGPGQMVPGQGGGRSGRRPPRRVSMSDEADMMPTTGSRRRQQSMPNNSFGPGNTQSQLFSQNFHLDGVMGSATDRYHFVSRARSKQKDLKLSSGEEAYSANRKFIHGSPVNSSNGYPNSMNMSIDSQGAYLGDVTNQSIPSSRRSVSNIANSHGVPGAMPNSVEPRQTLLPNTIVSTGPDFSGFTFGDDIDANGAGGGASSGSTGSHHLSSTGSNATPTRSRSGTGTPPTPQGTIDPTILKQGKWTPATPQVLPFDVS